MHALLDDLREEAILRCEIRQLPQASVETVFRKLLQHFHGILETILCKLIVALPVDSEPTCIKVDDIRGNLMSAQLTGNLQALLLREVSDTAHPCAKAPKRQHGALACDIGILIEDILRFTQEDEEVHLFISHKQAISTNVRGTEVAGHGG